MQQQKSLDLSASNIAGFGGTEDLEQRLAKAKLEDEFHGAGESVGLEIWRIENFGVKKWPKEQYGHFYSGDSYIVLRTYKKKPTSDALSWDVHFWLGMETTQDEAGTAAYKTVELDDLLHGRPVQHREVENHESDVFLSYFPKGIIIQDGGVATGFNHVGPKEYLPRLLHAKGKKNVRVGEVPLAAKSMNHGDVFILDTGEVLFQWNGKESNVHERRKAIELATQLKNERGGKAKLEVLEDDGREGYAFWKPLGEKSDVQDSGAAGSDVDAEKKGEPVVFRLSDASGSMEFKEEARGKFSKDILDSDDVFIVDVGLEIFVWIGKGATAEEKKSGMKYAMQYLQKYERPLMLPISRLIEGTESAVFDNVFE